MNIELSNDFHRKKSNDFVSNLVSSIMVPPYNYYIVPLGLEIYILKKESILRMNGQNGPFETHTFSRCQNFCVWGTKSAFLGVR